MAQVVPLERVISLPDSSSPYAVRKMKSVLVKQGQIEPLQVRAVGGNFVVFTQDAWGNEIVHAARELGWDTLLVVEMRRYER